MTGHPLTPVIRDVRCQDGISRRFTIQGKYEPHVYRGFVKYGCISISGIVTRKKRGGYWNFEANANGKNAHLVTPLRALPLNSTVRVIDINVPEYLRRRLAVIEQARMDGITPRYVVRFNNVGLTREVSHDGVKLAYES